MMMMMVMIVGVISGGVEQLSGRSLVSRQNVAIGTVHPHVSVEIA